jgi:hypothetical protein
MHYESTWRQYRFSSDPKRNHTRGGHYDWLLAMHLLCLFFRLSLFNLRGLSCQICGEFVVFGASELCQSRDSRFTGSAARIHHRKKWSTRSKPIGNCSSEVIDSCFSIVTQ